MNHKKYILSFCAQCGVLLPTGLGNRARPACENCGELITSRSDRIEGEFTEREGSRLLAISEGLPE